jgi:hypothetical protein
MFKLTCTLLVMFTISLNSFGQIKRQENNPLPFWYEYNNKLVKKLGLADLQHSNPSNYCRIWYDDLIISYALDIFKDKDSINQGFVTIYTQEMVDEQKELPTHRVYNNKIQLSESQADSIYQLIKNTGVAQFPTDSLIKGWEYGLDGTAYNFEWVNNYNHTYRSYWEPKAQENVNEAIIIQHFIDVMEKIIHIKQLEQEFAKKIPFENYGTSGGIRVAIRVLTVEQRRQYKKERDEYRRKHHIKKDSSQNTDE